MTEQVATSPAELAPPDYGTPLNFLIGIGLFSYVGAHLEQLLGIWTVIWVGVWAVITGRYYIQILKQGLGLSHPKTFTVNLLTLSIAGGYLSSCTSVETFTVFLVWGILYFIAAGWLSNNTKADKRLYYLISIQFLVIALSSGWVMKNVNPTLLGLCAAPAAAEHHANVSNEHLALMLASNETETQHDVPAAVVPTHPQAAALSYGRTENLVEEEAKVPAHAESHAAPPKASAETVAKAFIHAFTTIMFLLSLWISWRAFNLGRKNPIYPVE